MAADTVRGDGLFQAHRALAALAEDPEELDQARERRFSDSPPSYRSRSGTTTQPESPVDEDDPVAKYIARKDELYRDWMASTAPNQFGAQSREERQRIERSGQPVGVGNSPESLVADRVRERWIEQGIWDHKWYETNLERYGEAVVNEPFLDARWLHESPLEDDSDTVEEPPSEFKFGAKRKRQKTDEEARQSAERRAERLRKRDLTRPIHQFNYQVSQERERLLEEQAKEASDEDARKRYPPDISTQAYTLVKERWVSRRIWVDKWGVLPGMTWLHERDFDELALEELGPRPPPATAAAVSSDVAGATTLSGDESDLRVSDPREASVED